MKARAARSPQLYPRPRYSGGEGQGEGASSRHPNAHPIFVGPASADAIFGATSRGTPRPVLVRRKTSHRSARTHVPLAACPPVSPFLPTSRLARRAALQPAILFRRNTTWTSDT